MHDPEEEAVRHDLLLVNAELDRAADATARTRFVLVRNDDGSWQFGAPSMLSYSPRPGDMAGGATATEAMRGWIEANGEGEP